MQEWVLQLVEEYGYVIVTALIAIENLFPPIPSEVILTAGGFMTTTTGMQIWGVVVAATVGSVLGAVILYAAGRGFGAERLERILDGRVGRILRLKSEDVRRAQGWFEKRGKITVFLCRFIPIIRSLISIPAGVARMKVPIFLILTTIGTLIWNTVLVILGALAGESWATIAEYMGIYSKIGLVVLCVVGVTAVAIFYIRRKRNAEKENDTQ